ncbi:hypothetical protein [Micromonospora sp. WMMD1155]|uniref:hypothetical protein n=1 Tax=Micromonospora sp. WMMD1155 TaxID=3016094 RepID=UPI00249BB824|nr:hypothetical protein [Micromonospora sp. WMMD1155]WFE52353.1 hypothetical protein O7617_19405 [Micromonospora sp. WMMD1155]
MSVVGGGLIAVPRHAVIGLHRYGRPVGEALARRYASKADWNPAGRGGGDGRRLSIGRLSPRPSR